MRPVFKKAAIYAAVISAAIAAEIAIVRLCSDREDGGDGPQVVRWPVMGTVAQMTSRKHVDELEFGELFVLHVLLLRSYNERAACTGDACRATARVHI